MRQQNTPNEQQDVKPDDQREIRMTPDKIGQEAVPQRLLVLAAQLQASLVARRRGEIES